MVAAVNVVIPRRQPHIDALDHGLRLAHPVAHEHRAGHQHQPRQRQRQTAARYAEHGKEQEDDDQRRPQIFQHEEHGDRDRDAHHHRRHVLQPGYAEAAEQAGEEAPFAQVAQPFPVARAIAGQKDHQQDFDQLHRLEDAEIHLGVVAGRATAEAQQQAEQGDGGKQGRVAPIREAAIIAPRQRGRGQQQAPQEHAQRELMEFERIAQRVAHAGHEHQADTGQKLQGRQQSAIAAEPPQPPRQRHQVEAGKIERYPAQILRTELGRGADDEEGFQLGERQ